MSKWMEAQEKANAEEGRPWICEDAGGLEDVPLSRLVTKVCEVVPITVAPPVEGPIGLGVPVMTATPAGEVPLTLVTATLVSVGLPKVKGTSPGEGGQSLIKSFFTRG
jgi:hypothetical protein